VDISASIGYILNDITEQTIRLKKEHHKIATEQMAQNDVKLTGLLIDDNQQRSQFIQNQERIDVINHIVEKQELDARAAEKLESLLDELKDLDGTSQLSFITRGLIKNDIQRVMF
jgi:hypothetical protein